MLIDKRELEDRLSESGCCRRCIERCAPFVNYACGRDFSDTNGSDQSSPTQMKRAMKESDSFVNGNAEHELCFVCLDLLGDQQVRDLIEYCKNEINSAHYESPHFVLSVVTVQILEIRQILLALWLKEKFPALPLMEFMDRCLPIKQLLKDDLVTLLPEVLGLEYRTNSAFDVKVEVEASDTSFFTTLEKLDPDSFVMRTRRQQRAKKTPSQIFSRKSILSFFAQHSTDSLRGQFPFPFDPIRPLSKDALNGKTDDVSSDVSLITNKVSKSPFAFRVTLEHEPIFVGGRYNKYSRDLPQTPWIMEGVRLKESSIEEIIVTPIDALLRADEFKFSSSGREDVDVRCLGEGRPFVVECLNPRRVALTEEELRRLEEEINGVGGDKIRVTKMAMVSDRETAYLRKMENEKRKHYAAECHSLEKLTENDMTKLKGVHEQLIHQKTPIRVLHRRPLAVRPRRVHSIYEAELVDDHHFRIGLETEAGTYIKEFVHGDLGRTQPNLKEILGKEVDILKLDVEKVDVIWPLPPDFDFGNFFDTAENNPVVSSDEDDKDS